MFRCQESVLESRIQLPVQVTSEHNRRDLAYGRQSTEFGMEGVEVFRIPLTQLVVCVLGLFLGKEVLEDCVKEGEHLIDRRPPVGAGSAHTWAQVVLCYTRSTTEYIVDPFPLRIPPVRVSKELAL